MLNEGIREVEFLSRPQVPKPFILNPDFWPLAPDPRPLS
jgi:hypothetical protein